MDDAPNYDETIHMLAKDILTSEENKKRYVDDCLDAGVCPYCGSIDCLSQRYDMRHLRRAYCSSCKKKIELHVF